MDDKDKCHQSISYFVLYMMFSRPCLHTYANTKNKMIDLIIRLEGKVLISKGMKTRFDSVE